jgi:hypothetical protein
VMHTLRNRKTDRKSARRRFTEARRTSQTAIYPHLGGEIQHSNSNFQTFVGLKLSWFSLKWRGDVFR